MKFTGMYYKRSYHLQVEPGFSCYISALAIGRTADPETLIVPWFY